jgi:hypothetical protein
MARRETSSGTSRIASKALARRVGSFDCSADDSSDRAALARPESIGTSFRGGTGGGCFGLPGMRPFSSAIEGWPEFPLRFPQPASPIAAATKRSVRCFMIVAESLAVPEWPFN